ncbi:MAG: hypothetical protein ACFFDN_22835 [Candidatus Hodarchaeota archaeon]
MNIEEEEKFNKSGFIICFFIIWICHLYGVFFLVNIYAFIGLIIIILFTLIPKKAKMFLSGFLCPIIIILLVFNFLYLLIIGSTIYINFANIIYFLLPSIYIILNLIYLRKLLGL